jgi:putative Mg2+ transporter-C (MgtC) family protein
VNPWFIDMTDTAIRLGLALAFGGIIGLEREQSNHAAGFRTHILVCLGSALIMMLSIYGFSDFVNEPNVRMDPARLAAQVVSGIGFLGAGVILRNGFSIMGLTTAASLWVVAAIGLAVGAGFFFAAGVTTGIVIISLWLLNKIERRFFNRKKMHLINIKLKDSPRSLSIISERLEANGAEIGKMKVTQEAQKQSGEDSIISIELHVKLIKKKKLIPLIEEVRSLESVCEVNIE